MRLIKGLSPQPRLLWAIAIGAGLIALASVAPVIGLVAVVYHAGLVIVVARDLAMLPPASGFAARRTVPEPLSLGEREAVSVQVENPRAAGLTAVIADHAPPELSPAPRELAGRFDEAGHLGLHYTVFSPRRGAFHFGPIDVRLSRAGGWWRRQVTVRADSDVAVFPNVVAIKR
ncbi:MAG TPA: hypothetical protein VEW68_06815, partial [Patescibacteria group bacterium]|nr:hypothetical protein [Patescibacteria group bacterium]